MLAVHFFPLNVTPSMPYGLYMRLPAWNVKEGDLVEMANPLAYGSFGVRTGMALLKRVDHITDEGFYYVLGEHPQSYDSRYFGAVGKEYIRNRVVPVFTFRDLPDWLAGPSSEEDTNK